MYLHPYTITQINCCIRNKFSTENTFFERNILFLKYVEEEKSNYKLDSDEQCEGTTSRYQIYRESTEQIASKGSCRVSRSKYKLDTDSQCEGTTSEDQISVLYQAETPEKFFLLPPLLAMSSLWFDSLPLVFIPISVVH